MQRATLLVIIIGLLVYSSCVKRTIDMDKISDRMVLNPSIAIAAVKGEMTLSDVVEPNDTIMFDENNLVKIIFREDSVINFSVDEFYDAFPTTTFDETFQVIAFSTDYQDTLEIDPGSDYKIKEMQVITGQVTYSITSWCSFDISMDMVFPTVLDGTDPLLASLSVGADGTSSGSVSLDGMLVNLDSDISEPYNRLPVDYTILVSGSPVFDPGDSVRVEIVFEEPDFDYARGYFGMNSVESDWDTIDLGMEDIFSKLTGSIYLANPSITVDYSNSFGLPFQVDAEVIGKNATEEISLDRAPIDIEYPTSILSREVTSYFDINRDNSTLPDLISMLPNEIIFYGTALTNPDGETATDNLVFGNSRFKADVEVEIPMEFRIDNLQLSDTIENFLKSDNPDDMSPTEFIKKLRLEMYVNNGFPLGGRISIELYDTLTHTVLERVDSEDLFAPADVDINGDVIASVEHNSTLQVSDDFMAAIQDADELIMSFTLYTSNNGTQVVKIYSDYTIVFKAALWFEAEIDVE